jgi:ribosomal subunit interface protein
MVGHQTIVGRTYVDIVVKGRNVEVPDHYRDHVTDKLDKAVRFDRKIIEIDVELQHERNPRQQDNCQRVEITCFSRGLVVRAEATARDFYTALDEAITKLNNRLRRAADRRRVHRRSRAPISVAAATANLPTDLPPVDNGSDNGSRPAAYEQEFDDAPWRIVREKEHPGEPMTVDDALFHMELLGHDFYLFQDKDSGRPSVVYRRRGYDYGVISLANSGQAGSAGSRA